ncbi:hypothetical protein LXL04_026151 [Taraxacum kok-saghyz]
MGVTGVEKLIGARWEMGSEELYVYSSKNNDISNQFSVDKLVISYWEIICKNENPTRQSLPHSDESLLFVCLFDGHSPPTIPPNFGILVSGRLIGESGPQFFCILLQVHFSSSSVYMCVHLRSNSNQRNPILSISPTSPSLWLSNLSRFQYPTNDFCFYYHQPSIFLKKIPLFKIHPSKAYGNSPIANTHLVESWDHLFIDQSQMGDVAKDLAAGTVGGVAQLIVGHPFDTIKVKLQSQPTPLPGQLPKYSGAIDAVKKTLAAQGAGGLYKGMGAPLATVAVFNAVLFSVRGQMEALLKSEPGASLTVKQQFIAGAGAGFAVSFLATPTELLKCRLQAQGAGAAVAEGAAAATAALKYSGPMDVARQVLKSEGGALGLFKGFFPTIVREVPGNATMFGVYEALKQYIAGGTDTSGLSRGSLMMAGGLAGGAFWISVYPADVVKSVIQIDDFKNPKYSGAFDAFKKILKTEGVSGLYKGFGPAMGRSVPANAACFLAYEVTRSSLG